MSACDNEFVDVGKKDGLCIWRIENFKLIKQKQNEFGIRNKKCCVLFEFAN
jgi:hypothetical protein